MADSKPEQEISRRLVEAYATLRAVEHYYSDMLDGHMRDLLTRFAWVNVDEPQRVIKQKRIMSYVISRELAAAKGEEASSGP